MDTNLLYERVAQVKPMGQEAFLSALNYTVGELCSLYGEAVVRKGGPIHTLSRVGEDPCIEDAFEVAVLDNLLYFATGEERHKTDFVAHAQYAYHDLWRKKSAGKRIRKEAW